MRVPPRCPGALVRAALVAAFCAASAAPACAQCPGPQPEVEPNGTPATATPLTTPPVGMFAGVPGAISPAGDVDVFRINANVFTRLWLSVDSGGPQAPGATSRDTVIQVLAPDGTTIVETDDDDGTGNGQTGVITTSDASVVAGLPLVAAAGVYYVRVTAKTPGDVIAPYVLMVAVSQGTEAEVEPNDTFPTQIAVLPIVGALATPGDVDWYHASVLDFGLPFVVVDGDPERDGTSTDVVVDFAPGFPSMPQVNSSTGQGAPPPAAEGVVLPSIGNVRLSGPVAGTYAIGVFYSGEGCPVPVTLESFAVE